MDGHVPAMDGHVPVMDEHVQARSKLRHAQACCRGWLYPLAVQDLSDIRSIIKCYMREMFTKFNTWHPIVQSLLSLILQLILTSPLLELAEPLASPGGPPSMQVCCSQLVLMLPSLWQSPPP